MMEKVLALDISTKTGFAMFEHGKLVRYGTILSDKSPLEMGEYPDSFLNFARFMADEIKKLYDEFWGTELLPVPVVVCEETNPGKNVYSQKILEFIHCELIRRFERISTIKYVRTQVWRNITGSNQNSQEKKLNAKIGRIKKKTGKKLAKIDGKVVGKKTRKHASIRSFQEHFGIELKRKEEDAAEAALLGLAFLKGAPRCDGSVFGGTLKGAR